MILSHHSSRVSSTATAVTVSVSMVLAGLAAAAPAGAVEETPPSILNEHVSQEGTPQGELSLTDGEVVSFDADGVASYDAPELPDAPPSTGDRSPGATMGMYQKSLASAAHLSDESEQSMARIAGGDAEADGTTTTESGAASETPLDPAGEAPAADVPVAETPAADAPASGSPETDQAQVGPAGAMSMVVVNGAWQPAGIQGMDVSGWQPSVNWSREYSLGARFAYVKATEGTSYRSPAFNSQYIGSYQTGMIRGAYHFAIPSRSSSGAAQADYFVNNGGGWSADGKTLPGLLDIEYNPYPAYGDVCFNLTHSEMRNWIKSFSDRYKQRTGRLPAIYTATDWWVQCTGNTNMFNDHPLHIAQWTNSPGPMPNGWNTHDIWQYSDRGPFSGDSNVYGGSWGQLQDMARNASYKPLGGRAPAAAAGPFVDVSPSNQFVREITWVKDRGYLNGWPDGTFRPVQPIDRDAMAAVAYRLAGSPAYTPPARSPYRDVATTHQFYKEITWARSAGYLTGWPDGTFRPNNKITRDATAAMFYRMAGSPAYTPPATSRFPDIHRGQQFYREIHWFAAQGITTGYANGTYRPLNTTNRDAMAAFIYRYIN
ncbi:GH25 family lysozyme [Kocuria coralli]|uniref:GH25 family lysozyme n=1 Tax=Kocuria coralli TaxID=1461025 RepID=UPI0015F2DA5C|nr:GH25 family lysozyme [Kocuria coralli]